MILRRFFGFLNYEEFPNGSVSLTSINVVNHSNLGVSLGEAYIIASPDPCESMCITGPYYNYQVSPDRIGTENSGLGVVSPHTQRDIQLIPSGNSNTNNSFFQNYSISITANFYQFSNSRNETFYYRSLSVTLQR